MSTPSSSVPRAVRSLVIVGIVTSGLSLVGCGPSSVDGGSPTSETQILSHAIWDDQVGSTKDLVEASELIVLARPSAEPPKASGSLGHSKIEMKQFEVVRVIAGTAVKPGEMIRVGRFVPAGDSSLQNEPNSAEEFQPPFDGALYLLGLVDSSSDYGAGSWSTIGGPSSVYEVRDERLIVSPDGRRDQELTEVLAAIELAWAAKAPPVQTTLNEVDRSDEQLTPNDYN